MLSRNHLETRYSYCGHTCDPNYDATSIVMDTDIDMVDDGDTVDMNMDMDTDTGRTIDLLLLNGDSDNDSDSEDDEDHIEAGESLRSLSHSAAHKKWEYLACKKVKDEIDDYSYSTIEDCSIILTNCADDEFKSEDTENYLMKKKNGETYVVTDKRDIEDADILYYTFTKLIG